VVDVMGRSSSVAAFTINQAMNQSMKKQLTVRNNDDDDNNNNNINLRRAATVKKGSFSRLLPISQHTASSSNA
jgi:hypothetical protein